MSDTVVAVVTINEVGIHEGDVWPADHPRVAANPDWFSGPDATEPEPEPAPEPEPEPSHSIFPEDAE